MKFLIRQAMKTEHIKSEQEYYIDIHCHCLPAVDDGPSTLSESLSLCRALADDCISDVIATPHQLGRFSDCNEAAQVRDQVAALNEELESNGISLKVVAGGDVRVDERICQLIEADKVLTLADGGKYILLELPHEVFIDVEPLLFGLSSLGIQAIISHPERHHVLAKQHNMLLKWLAQGAHLQVTAGSLLGGFGPMAQREAWHFLGSGWASFVATDAHNLDDRGPCMKAAFKHISIRLGETVARLVCIENPLRILEGRNIQMIGSTARKRIDERVPSSS
jgi:protein-tyrosine phosphatase